MRIARFAEEVLRTRGRLEVLNRTYKRDDRGRFGSGSGGVRDALSAASTAREVGAAASAEAKRITGRDIPFSLEGMDPQMAREQSEGVLRGLERFPAAQLERVYSFNSETMDSLETDGLFAVTVHGNAWTITRDSQSKIGFNSDYFGDPDAFGAALVRPGAMTGPASTPMGIGIHEVAHVVSFYSDAEDDAGAIADTHASAAGMSTSSYVAREIGTYAATDHGEMLAEAVADVMVNGSSASDLSKALDGHLESSYDTELARRAEGTL